MSQDDRRVRLFKTQLKYENDIVTARQKARRLCQALGFDGQDQSRVATALSELARNAYQYAGSGAVEFFVSTDDNQTLFISVVDSGPGVADLDSILDGSYVSRTGMGIGLSGSKMLVDLFDVESTPKRGTRVTIGKRLPPRARAFSREELGLLSEKLIAGPPETAFEEIRNQNRDLIAALEELGARRQELSELNRELAETNRGVVALYAELDEKAASLQRANEVKTSFLANMTHEFRTPLSSIISLTRLLLQEVDGPLSDEQTRQVNFIRDSGEALLSLVNDLLDIAKVEAGKVALHPSKFTIGELMGGIRGMFRPIMGSDSSIELAVDWIGEYPELETDQGKLSQILRNLVSNAIKFTEKGRVSAFAQCDAQWVRITISDTGIGIDPKHLESIFEDFSQVPSPTQRRSQGTGLGLPLSRKLARLLGGNLRVESGPEQGSTFILEIPRVYSGSREGVLIEASAPRADAAAAKADAPKNSRAGPSFRVLVIDDDEASRYLIKSLLGAEFDAEFLEESTGPGGLATAIAETPDLVLLDLGMPEMDGFEVLRRMRLNGATKETPVIINTSRPLSTVENEALRKATAGVLSKERGDSAESLGDLRRALANAGFDYGARRDDA